MSHRFNPCSPCCCPATSVCAELDKTRYSVTREDVIFAPELPRIVIGDPSVSYPRDTTTSHPANLTNILLTLIWVGGCQWNSYDGVSGHLGSPFWDNWYWYSFTLRPYGTGWEIYVEGEVDFGYQDAPYTAAGPTPFWVRFYHEGDLSLYDEGGFPPPPTVYNHFYYDSHDGGVMLQEVLGEWVEQDPDDFEIIFRCDNGHWCPPNPQPKELYLTIESDEPALDGLTGTCNLTGGQVIATGANVVTVERIYAVIIEFAGSGAGPSAGGGTIFVKWYNTVAGYEIWFNLDSTTYTSATSFSCDPIFLDSGNINLTGSYAGYYARFTLSV